MAKVNDRVHRPPSGDGGYPTCPPSGDGGYAACVHRRATVDTLLAKWRSRTVRQTLCHAAPRSILPGFPRVLSDFP